VIAIKNVVDSDHLMIINKSGLAIRLNVANLRVIGRAAQGVTLIKLKGKDSIAAVAKVVAEEEDEFDVILDENGNVIEQVVDNDTAATENTDVTDNTMTPADDTNVEDTSTEDAPEADDKDDE
jgi:DNA gyrase subunit A